MLVAKLPNSPVMCNMDATRIVQAIVNLLTNANRYCPEGAVVEVQLRQDGDQAVVTVSDNGPGLGGVDVSRIFEFFYRHGRKGDGEGLGLGLWISRQLVVLHGGSIAAASGWQGAPGNRGPGSVFSICLPLEREEESTSGPAGSPKEAGPGDKAEHA